MKMNIKVVMADDHALFRKGVIELFRGNFYINIIDDVGDGKNLIKSYFKLKPDVILVDIAMPVFSGLQAFEKIKSLHTEVKALFLSMHTEEVYYYQVYKSGGKGLLSKKIIPTELEKAIIDIYDGKIYFGKEYPEDRLKELVKIYNKNENNTSRNKIELSEKEIEILKYIKDCNTSEEIASILDISQRTVEKHRANIIRKAGTKNLIDLYRFAVENTRDNN